MHGAEELAMICYDGTTMLDLIGPQYFVAAMMGSKVHLETNDADLKPIVGDTGFVIVPTMSTANCPADLGILFAPGGAMGTVRVMEDESWMEFTADRGSLAKHVTSVCTGSQSLA